MNRRAVVAAVATVGAGALGAAGWLAYRTYDEHAAAERWIADASAGPEVPIARPHRLAPGRTPADCATGPALAGALAEAHAIAPAHVREIERFLAGRGGAADVEPIRPSLQAIEPVVHRALDASACEDALPLPATADVDALGIVLAGAEAHARAHLALGDAEGGARWALDLWNLGRDLGEWGTFAEYEAGLRASEAAQRWLGEVLASGSIAGSGARVADDVAFLLDAGGPPVGAVDHEIGRTTRAIVAGPGSAAERKARALEYLADMHALRAALESRPENREAALIAWGRTARPPAPTADRVADLLRREDEVRRRGGGLLLAAALRAWLEREATCPADADAVRAVIPKEAGREGTVRTGTIYDPEACAVTVIGADGAVLAEWSFATAAVTGVR